MRFPVFNGISFPLFTSCLSEGFLGFSFAYTKELKGKALYASLLSPCVVLGAVHRCSPEGFALHMTWSGEFALVEQNEFTQPVILVPEPASGTSVLKDQGHPPKHLLQ